MMSSAKSKSASNFGKAKRLATKEMQTKKEANKTLALIDAMFKKGHITDKQKSTLQKLVNENTDNTTDDEAFTGNENDFFETSAKLKRRIRKLKKKIDKLEPKIDEAVVNGDENAAATLMHNRIILSRERQELMSTVREVEAEEKANGTFEEDTTTDKELDAEIEAENKSKEDAKKQAKKDAESDVVEDEKVNETPEPATKAETKEKPETQKESADDSLNDIENGSTKAIINRIANQLKDGKEVKYTKQEAIDAVKSDPDFKTIDNADGSVTVVDVKDNNGEWTMVKENQARIDAQQHSSNADIVDDGSEDTSEMYPDETTEEEMTEEEIQNMFCGK